MRSLLLLLLIPITPGDETSFLVTHFYRSMMRCPTDFVSEPIPCWAAGTSPSQSMHSWSVETWPPNPQQGQAAEFQTTTFKLLTKEKTHSVNCVLTGYLLNDSECPRDSVVFNYPEDFNLSFDSASYTISNATKRLRTEDNGDHHNVSLKKGGSRTCCFLSKKKIMRTNYGKRCSVF